MVIIILDCDIDTLDNGHDLSMQTVAIEGIRGTVRTVLQNIYYADIVIWLANSAEQIMNSYKCGICILAKHFSTRMLLFS